MSLNRSADLLRVVFIGEEISILNALAVSANLVGVYGYVQEFSFFRSVKPWLLSNKLLRKNIRNSVRRNPCRFVKWRRHLVRFQVSDYAIQHKFPLIQAKSINDAAFIKTLTNLKPDLGIVANFGEILKPPLLHIPRYGFINFHPSLLPKYRGPEPVMQMLLHCEKKAGASWHKVIEDIDAGEILAQKAFQIHAQDTAQTIFKKAAGTAVKMLPELLSEIANGNSQSIEQDPALATYYPKLRKADKNPFKGLTAGEIRKTINLVRYR